MSTASLRPMRVISLLPSATEQFSSIVAAAKILGIPNLPVLVGRSHECDFPAAYANVPVLTKPRTTFTSCEEVHNEVLQLLQTDNSLYEIDTKTLLELKADLILVQDVCKVCSIDRPSVSCAVGDSSTQVLLVNSRTLSNALVDSVMLLGKALGLEKAAQAVVDRNNKIQTQLQSQAVQLRKKPVVYIVEWLQPLFIVKGWAAEMVEIAGGAMPTESGKILDPSKLEPADIIVVALCGLDRDVTKKEIQSKPLPEWWIKSPAVRHGHVFVVDGNQMFNRPTNRLLDALEWLVQLIPGPENIENTAKAFPFERYSHIAPPKERSLEDEIKAAHEAACAAKQARYDDPATGYGVFTAWYLAERQACCGNRCRHCPYGHVNVPIENLGYKVNAMTNSVFLKAPKPMAKGRLGYLKPPRGKSREIIVVFWSGGKDSFLALYETIQQLRDDQEIVLLTTFNPDSNVVPVQNIAPRTIVEQAAVLNLPLFLVAVPTGADYTTLVKNALKELVTSRMTKSGGTIGALVFGDLHLSDVKDWRNTTFSEFPLHSPLWHRDMCNDLIPLLTQLCVTYKARVAYSAVDESLLPGVRQGDAYVSSKVPPAVDPMGENGEFHTVVIFDK